MKFEFIINSNNNNSNNNNNNNNNAFVIWVKNCPIVYTVNIILY